MAMTSEDHEVILDRIITMYEAIGDGDQRAKQTRNVTTMLMANMKWLAVKIVHCTIVGIEDPTKQLPRLEELYRTLTHEILKLAALPKADILWTALKLLERVNEEIYCETITSLFVHAESRPLVDVCPELKARDDTFTMFRKMICIKTGTKYQPATPDVEFFQKSSTFMTGKNKTFVDLCIGCLDCFETLAMNIMKMKLLVDHRDHQYTATDIERIEAMYKQFNRNVKQIPFFASKVSVDRLVAHYGPFLAEVYKELHVAPKPKEEKSKTETKTKKGPVEAQAECTNCAVTCDTAGVVLKACSRCQLVRYCTKACQVQHWKDGGHKRFCVAVAKRSPGANSSVPTVGETCMVCLEGLTVSPTDTLPCGHVLHSACAKSIKDFAAAQACPLCRKQLP